MTLTEFLLARITEDEAAVEGATHWKPLYASGAAIELTHDGLMIDPARVLAECEAKRRIVELHGGDHDCNVDDEGIVWSNAPCATLLALALPYADHPDYREEWTP